MSPYSGMQTDRHSTCVPMINKNRIEKTQMMLQVIIH